MESRESQQDGVNEWGSGENEYAKLAQGEGQKTHADELRYISPSEQDPDDFPEHKFELTRDGKPIAGAEIDYLTKPLPLYQLSELWSEIPGQGHASKVMAAVEEFLRARHKPGVLAEAIMDDNPALGMYERRGWIPVPDGMGLHVYNWPEHVSLDVLKGYPMRYTPLEDRGPWKDRFDKGATD